MHRKRRNHFLFFLRRKELLAKEFTPLSKLCIQSQQYFFISVPQKSVFTMNEVVASSLGESLPACNWLLLEVLDITLVGRIIDPGSTSETATVALVLGSPFPTQAEGEGERRKRVFG